MSNLVEFGLKNVYFATFSLSGSDIVYGTPEAHPGAVAMVLAPEGQLTEFYADNGIYFTKAKNNGYKGSMELARISDWFRENVLNEIKDANLVYTEDSAESITPVAMLFEVDGDEAANLFAFYNVQASRPAADASTKTSVEEPKTVKFDISCNPAQDTGYIRARASEAATTAAATW